MLVEGITKAAVNATSLGAAAGISSPEMAQGWAEPGNMLQMGANLTAMLGFWAILRQMLPFEYIDHINKMLAPYLDRFNSYAFFDIPENIGDAPNDLFDAVQAHLSLATAQTAHKASLVRSKGATKVSYAMSAGSDWTLETFQGCPVWWSLVQLNVGKETQMQLDRSFTLKIQKRNKEKILDAYLEHVIRNAKQVKQGNRERQLYTNSTGSWYGSRLWTSIPFHHPSTFETLALDPEQKEIILDDLRAFVKAEDFYKRVGRAWKRGYLLYGPPGTGKSSMIAAMANFLNYDIYDLELTQVKNNMELRKILLQTTSKSIIVIEDIDCTIDLPNRAEASKTDSENSEKKDDNPKKKGDSAGVTLSGLLNFTDGIWSCCGSERIIVFTTNHIQKLDPALLRSGRMDMKIHLSYCGFPAFKVLAANYLGIQDHDLFPKVEEAMAGSHMTPADVTEYLINSSDVATALQELISGLEANKLQPLPTEGDATPVLAATPASDDKTSEAQAETGAPAQRRTDHGAATSEGGEKGAAEAGETQGQDQQSSAPLQQTGEDPKLTATISTVTVPSEPSTQQKTLAGAAE